MLTDNCSSRGKAAAIPNLNNLIVAYLPPNCTSKIQPMDARIQAALKLRYLKFHMELALHNIDDDFQNNYKVDVLVFMQWFKKAYNELSASLIANCWRHTNLFKINGCGTFQFGY